MLHKLKILSLAEHNQLNSKHGCRDIWDCNFLKFSVLSVALIGSICEDNISWWQTQVSSKFFYIWHKIKEARRSCLVKWNSWWVLHPPWETGAQKRYKNFTWKGLCLTVDKKWLTILQVVPDSKYILPRS